MFEITPMLDGRIPHQRVASKVLNHLSAAWIPPSLDLILRDALLIEDGNVNRLILPKPE